MKLNRILMAFVCFWTFGLFFSPILSGQSGEGSRDPELFDVRDFGAVGDGKTIDTEAIQKAIDACHAAGGGTVYLPKGVWVSGSLHLKSYIDFHLAPQAILLGSSNPDDYDKPDFVPQNAAFSSDFVKGGHLINAIEQTKIRISGRGRIDGNGPFFLKDPESDKLLPKQKIPWRPGQMIFFCESTDIVIEEVELYNSPYWNCFIHGCRNVRIDGVRIWCRSDTANGDGIDIDCSQNVMICHCNIESGDDCITLRASDSLLKEKRFCENITVTNSILSSPHCGVRIGVGNGVIRNAVFSNLAIYNGRIGLNLFSSYTEGSPGVSIDNVRFDNIVMDVVQPITMTLGYAAPETHIQNIYFNGLSGRFAGQSTIVGRPDNPLRHIVLSNLFFDYREGTVPLSEPLKIEFVEGLETFNLHFPQQSNPNEKRGTESSP
ncbi:MAG: glycosyl hydrolase family 28 protein [Planctomycetia bacterium]|nr:glycosyl hydrolase family 28 protein [Planctomycetia bacterium]